jgi:vacuolar-type H+-ATPase subunit E/Vma4
MPHDILLNGGVSYHKRFKTLSETTRKDIKSAATAEDVDKWLEQYRRFAAVSKYYRNPKCEIVQIRETEYLTDVLTYLTHFSLY